MCGTFWSLPGTILCVEEVGQQMQTLLGLSLQILVFDDRHLGKHLTKSTPFQHFSSKPLGICCMCLQRLLKLAQVWDFAVWIIWGWTTHRYILSPRPMAAFHFVIHWFEAGCGWSGEQLVTIGTAWAAAGVSASQDVEVVLQGVDKAKGSTMDVPCGKCHSQRIC